MRYENPAECPLCPANGQVKILEETELAYATVPLRSPLACCLLFVPKQHVVDFMGLPDSWTKEVKDLLRLLAYSRPVWYHREGNYSHSVNDGQEAGQTLAHFHQWMVPRGGEKEGPRTRRLGMATIIANAAGQT